ncbi:UGMP family protein [archaeon SCG-AAA382B04]|nr:UGMP family protein [archaeon SCG-AAA382B04]
MISLGIEGTAWNLSVGIVNDQKILSHQQHPYQPSDGGIHPREASQHHSDKIAKIIKKTVSNANIQPQQIDLISFSLGPGMGPCLRVIATAARALTLTLEKPLVGVNHCIAHIESGKWSTGLDDPIILYVSGANSQVLGYKSKRYRVFGETLDIGLGNALDKFARKLNLNHPGGPKIEKLAKKGEKLIELPYSVKGMDFSFSGLVTAAEKKLQRGEKKEDICYSLQEYSFSMLTEVAERALAHSGKKELLLCGGVGKNQRLKQMLKEMSLEYQIKFGYPKKELMGDNGAMIAHTAIKMYESGIEHSPGIEVKTDYRTDEVEVKWRE